MVLLGGKGGRYIEWDRNTHDHQVIYFNQYFTKKIKSTKNPSFDGLIYSNFMVIGTSSTDRTGMPLYSAGFHFPLFSIS